MQPDTETVWRWLDEVPDPEIPVISITELGIIRDVEWQDDTLVVTVTPTYSGCPATSVINLEIERKLRERGIEKIVLKRQISPPWSTDWIAEAAKEKLRAYGIAPPIEGTGAAGVVAGTVNGLVNAIVLPEALRFNRPALASAIPEIAHALDVAGGDAEEEFRRILHVVRTVLDRLPIPSRLRDLPLTHDMLPRIAEEAMEDWALATNPRRVTAPAELESVLEAVW